MEIDFASHIALVEKIGKTTVSSPIKSLMSYSIVILMRDYRLTSVKIVAVIKALNQKEYVILQAERAFFMTQDGYSWSPLPVLSTEESLILHAIGYGIFSLHPFTGDPAVQLYNNLTESHRLSNLIYYIESISPYPQNALKQAQRFAGLSSAEAEDFSSYEVAPIDDHQRPDFRTVNYDMLNALQQEHMDESMISFEELQKFQFSSAILSSKEENGGVTNFHKPLRQEDWIIASDPYRRLTTLSHKHWTGLHSFLYWKSRVYGWFYSPPLGANSALYRLPDLIFIHARPGFVPKEELEEQRSKAELKAKYKDEEEQILASRANKKAARLEARRNAEEQIRLRLERREQRRLEREAAEEAARKAAEEAEEAEDGEENGETE